MWNKVGFHIAANCGGCSGIGEYWEELDKAGIPFTVYSANEEGVLVAASVYPHATLIYRDVAASTVNPVDYSKPPQTVAAYYWRRTVDALPSFVVKNKGRVWIELLNEPGREPDQARWVGGLMYHMARHALLDGYRVMGPGWGAGNPEPEAWETPEWRDYLTLCSLLPNQIAVSLHEYSLENDIRFGAPWHVGRFLQLYHACGRMGIPVPLIFITECGWTLNSMPPRAQAEQDIDFIADWYSQYPEIRCAALWTLQSGKGNGNLPQRLNALIPWLTEYTIENYQPGDADLPPAGEEPVSEPVKHKAIVVLAPQNVTKPQWMTIADYAYQFRHTMTASYDDMLTVIAGGNEESYVKVAMPALQQDVIANLSGTGIKWMPVLSEQVTPPF